MVPQVFWQYLVVHLFRSPSFLLRIYWLPMCGVSFLTHCCVSWLIRSGKIGLIWIWSISTVSDKYYTQDIQINRGIQKVVISYRYKQCFHIVVNDVLSRCSRALNYRTNQCCNFMLLWRVCNILENNLVELLPDQLQSSKKKSICFTFWHVFF